MQTVSTIGLDIAKSVFQLHQPSAFSMKFAIVFLATLSPVGLKW